MSQHIDSDWYEQVRQLLAQDEAVKPPKKRKKDWDEALVAASEKELEERDEKANDRDWLYIEQRREVYSTVKLAWDIVERSGVVGLVEQWRIEDGLITNRGGRRRKVSIHAALTLWLLLAIQREAQHFQDMGRKIAFGLTPAIWELLGLTEEKFDLKNRGQRRKIRERWSDRVWYTIWVTRETMEPYPEIRLKERYTVGEWLDLVPGGELDVDDDEETAAFREKRRARGRSSRTASSGPALNSWTPRRSLRGTGRWPSTVPRSRCRNAGTQVASASKTGPFQRTHSWPRLLWPAGTTRRLLTTTVSDRTCGVARLLGVSKRP